LSIRRCSSADLCLLPVYTERLVSRLDGYIIVLSLKINSRPGLIFEPYIHPVSWQYILVYVFLLELMLKSRAHHTSNTWMNYSVVAHLNIERFVVNISVGQNFYY
jgi:hypothetical protein